MKRTTTMVTFVEWNDEVLEAGVECLTAGYRTHNHLVVGLIGHWLKTQQATAYSWWTDWVSRITTLRTMLCQQQQQQDSSRQTVSSAVVISLHLPSGHRVIPIFKRWLLTECGSPSSVRENDDHALTYTYAWSVEFSLN